MQTKWWHFVLGAIAIGALFLMIWRFQNTSTSPIITDNIPAGNNAKAALELKHE